MREIRFYHEFEENGEFSNYYMTPISVQGKTWPSVEHYYQAQKTLDAAYAERIRQSATPDEAKDLGNAPDCPMREDWDERKVEAMRRGLYAKFTQHAGLKEKLIGTGDAVLMENSMTDYYWGVGADGTGLSMLGKLLMALRAELSRPERKKDEHFARGRLARERYEGGALRDAAMGRAACDLRLDNVQIVNVLTGEVYPGAISVRDGVIVHVAGADEEPLAARQVYDGGGQYAAPGLFDPHLHVESSMLTPDHFARAVVPLGTTGAVMDPHEIANVLGVEGVLYMLAASANAPMRQFVAAPSCVPAVPGLERAGASFQAGEIEALLQADPRVAGVAEVMDYPGAIAGDERMESICAQARRRQLPIQGHAPSVCGRALSAYLLAGPENDHESTARQEVVEKLRKGMLVYLRGCSLGEKGASLIDALRDLRYQDRVSLCTDDVPVSQIADGGHLNRVVERAIELGAAPIDAIRMASLNAAQSYGLTNLGAIAPGFLADIMLLPSLQTIRPTAVFVDGKLAAQNGKAVWAEDAHRAYALEKVDTVRCEMASPEALRIKAPDGAGATARTLVIAYEQGGFMGTHIEYRDLPVRGGFLDLRGQDGLMYAAVKNRHGAGGMALAVVKDLGLTSGALCASNAHDSHNLTCVFDDPADGAAAINRVIAMKGGWCLCEGGALEAELALPIAGLMSPLPAEELAPRAKALMDALARRGLSDSMRLSALPLPVIPEVRLSDLGIVDVARQRFLPLFPQA